MIGGLHRDIFQTGQVLGFLRAHNIGIPALDDGLLVISRGAKGDFDVHPAFQFLDVSPDTSINRRVLADDRLLCVTQLDRIRIQFALSELQEVSRSGHNAFRAPVPERILRLQRREFFRLQVPIAHAPSCILNAKGVDDTPRQVDARVLDISVGGVALQLPPAVAEFVIGGKLDDCTLRLPELDPIPLHLEVRNINRNVQRSGTELLRLGCQFVGLSRSGENVIQHYIFNTERERNARERGGI